ncbi:MAG: hypothetical protein WAV90_00575 [Gordonia amarae]
MPDTDGLWCRHCGPEHPLRIEWRDEIVARPLGSFSLAGAQMKFSATKRQWPWAICDNCGHESKGKTE